MDRMSDGKMRKVRGSRSGLLRVFLAAAVFFAVILGRGGTFCLAAGAKEADSSGADAVFRNPDTGYEVRLEDRAGLLTAGQREKLSGEMEKITDYGNAAFVTTDSNRSSTEDFARRCYRKWFGTDSGTVFVIDMDNRNIWIYSDGAVWDVVTTDYANTVTDNVYRYASEEDYYGCASEAFKEIHALLEGRRIAQPMKYISNALLAMLLALLINYGLAASLSMRRGPAERTILANIRRQFLYSGIGAIYTHQTKDYDPIFKGDGGSSSGGGGGGHSGGSSGGHSGGGGGHKF